MGGGELALTVSQPVRWSGGTDHEVIVIVHGEPPFLLGPRKTKHPLREWVLILSFVDQVKTHAPSGRAVDELVVVCWKEKRTIGLV